MISITTYMGATKEKLTDFLKVCEIPFTVSEDTTGIKCWKFNIDTNNHLLINGFFKQFPEI